MRISPAFQPPQSLLKHPGSRSPGVTLSQTELASIRAIAVGLTPKEDREKICHEELLANMQQATSASALGWRTSLFESRRKRLLEQEQERQRREQELLLQDQQEEELKKVQHRIAVEKARAVILRRDESIRTFLQAQMVADTLAGQKEQKRWAVEKKALDQLREEHIEKKRQELLRQQAERDQRESKEQQAKMRQALATIIQQTQEREEEREKELRALTAEAEATKIRLRSEQQAEEEALKAKAEETKKRYTELMKENGQLQERRKEAAAQQVAEEAAASAFAEKLRERQETIRKKTEELRALSLKRSQQLTDRGAAALAAGKAQEIAHSARQAATWWTAVSQAEEIRKENRAALLQDLHEIRAKQIEAKKQENERRRKEEAEYAEGLRVAAAEADVAEQKQRELQRAQRVEVRLQQEQQAMLKRQQKKKEREQLLKEEKDSIDALNAADLEVQKFAEKETAAAKAASAEWSILERARQRLLRQSTVGRPAKKKPSWDSGNSSDEDLHSLKLL
ncbi:hypothetical protein Efla_001321 [Eimeria flavescens]